MRVVAGGGSDVTVVVVVAVVLVLYIYISLWDVVCAVSSDILYSLISFRTWLYVINFSAIRYSLSVSLAPILE